jgi:acyl-CoA hydrolase
MTDEQNQKIVGKPISASRITLTQLMQTEHANILGNVHGGWIMKLVDEAGALAAMRHSQKRVVTIAVDQMVFRHPIRTTDLVILNAEVSYTGRTSIETEVQVLAENPLTGECWHTNTAYIVYVALDQAGQPTPVPPLIPETEEQRLRMETGQQRQAQRKARFANALPIEIPHREPST